MNRRILTFVVSLLAIFGVAAVLIYAATSADEQKSPPIFKPELNTEKDRGAATKTEKRLNAQISNRADLNLRECPSVDCNVIAILKRGGDVHLTGLRKMVEGPSGAAIPWVEVNGQSEYCIKLAPGRSLECIEWGSGSAYSGWVNELYIQSK